MIPGILPNNARTVVPLVDALLKRFNLSIINLIILVVSDAIITYLSVIVIAFPLAHDSLCFQIVLREQSFCGVNCWWAGLVSQYCSICAKQSSHYNTYVNNKYNNVLVMLLRTYMVTTHVLQSFVHFIYTACRIISLLFDVVFMTIILLNYSNYKYFVNLLINGRFVPLSIIILWKYFAENTQMCYFI